MPHTNPNRNKSQTVHNLRRQKQSGDQHILPEDEPALDPHRPHRISREDMQKIMPPESEPDEPTSP